MYWGQGLLLALCLTAAGAAAVLEGDPMRLPNTRPTELAAGSGELLPDKLRILIIVRGISYSSRYRNGANSYERTHQNFFSHMVEPWRQQGHSVDVGLSTYDSEKLPEIRVLYSPVFVFATKTSYNAPSRTKLDSIVEGLQAALDAGGANRWDFIAVTRFDIELRQPITQYSIDFGKMNFPWPEKNWKDETFASLPRVGDAMQLFNSAYLRVLLDGFRNLVQLAKALRSNSSYNNGHRILTVMDIDLQEDVHCILNATSSQQVEQGKCHLQGSSVRDSQPVAAIAQENAGERRKPSCDRAPPAPDQVAQTWRHPMDGAPGLQNNGSSDPAQ
eukprot:CAMPEP_0117680724 /NCGR_PEP_ID=MMETSP0804-20121206/18529_1 /TAXON_ID=1074897 /ORGANISM="Tetraselmis astigmatica, Strain CCMP880" /LENGTH=330 /DNA_ID=CAMNT_0005490289 /DNA_START=303 /DNA_END=1294 /DNA_ORIENTATION=+